MKKKLRKGRFWGRKGFTLIELIVVLAVITVLTSISLVSFSSFGKSQALQAAASDVASLLQTARSRALSQVKPTVCAATQLDGYKVTVTPSGSGYALQAVCDGTSHLLTQQNLPAGTTFLSSSSSEVFFRVLKGTANASRVVLTSSGAFRVIDVDPVGTIKFSPVSALTPTVTPTVTPTPKPTNTPTPTLIPTSAYTPTPTPTKTPTPTPTPTYTPTPTPTPAIICSSSSNKKCSWVSTCSPNGAICQCKDPNQTSANKKYQCVSGSWQYQSNTSNAVCPANCN